jgi:glutamyl/glutaminyl-tRNA synthetase
MEDHDRSRCAPGFESSILADLDWLGFVGDAASRESLRSRPSPFRQSDHPQRYQRAFDQLRRTAEVYRCTCTRGTLGPADELGEHHYPGTCRGAPVDGDGGGVIRVRIPDDSVTFHDLRLGPVTQHPQRDHGDVVIRDARGQWTYQFCVVVDDLYDEVDLIVRGEDLVGSTGRQFLLAQLLGREEMPAMLHHSLLYAADGKKLSKRDRSETVVAMRERGMTAAEVVGAAVRPGSSS